MSKFQCEFHACDDQQAELAGALLEDCCSLAVHMYLCMCDSCQEITIPFANKGRWDKADCVWRRLRQPRHRDEHLRRASGELQRGISDQLKQLVFLTWSNQPYESVLTGRAIY